MDDKILDVAIALERLYEPENPELNFRLKTRAACFLEADMDGRKEVFKEIGRFYSARSAIVHGGKRKKHDEDQIAEDRLAVFETGCELARRTLLKLLRDGRPEDWNDVVLEPGAHVLGRCREHRDRLAEQEPAGGGALDESPRLAGCSARRAAGAVSPDDGGRHLHQGIHGEAGTGEREAAPGDVTTG